MSVLHIFSLVRQLSLLKSLGASKLPSMNALSGKLVANVSDILSLPDNSDADMMTIIQGIQDRKHQQIQLLSLGIREFLDFRSPEDHALIPPFLDSYFTLDIGLSLLISEQINLATNSPNPVQKVSLVSYY